MGERSQKLRGQGGCKIFFAPGSIQYTVVSCVSLGNRTLCTPQIHTNVAKWEWDLSYCTLTSTLPCQWPSGSVYCFEISISKIQLTPNQDNRRARTEVLDFLIPHGFHMIQGVRVSNGKTQDNNVGPEINTCICLQ